MRAGFHPSEPGVHNELGRLTQVEHRLVCTIPQVNRDTVTLAEHHVVAFSAVKHSLLKWVVDLLKFAANYFKEPDSVESLVPVVGDCDTVGVLLVRKDLERVEICLALYEELLLMLRRNLNYVIAIVIPLFFQLDVGRVGLYLFDQSSLHFTLTLMLLPLLLRLLLPLRFRLLKCYIGAGPEIALTRNRLSNLGVGDFGDGCCQSLQLFPLVLTHTHINPDEIHVLRLRVIFFLVHQIVGCALPPHHEIVAAILCTGHDILTTEERSKSNRLGSLHLHTESQKVLRLHRDRLETVHLQRLLKRIDPQHVVRQIVDPFFQSSKHERLQDAERRSPKLELYGFPDPQVQRQVRREEITLLLGKLVDLNVLYV